MAEPAVSRKPTGQTSLAAAVDVDVARRKLGDLVVRVGVANERIAIDRYGVRTAYLIGQSDFELLLTLEKEKKGKK